MKKHITLNNLAWALAFLVPAVIATMLASACLKLQKQTAPNTFTPEQIQTLDNLEKPLVFDGMFLDDSNS